MTRYGLQLDSVIAGFRTFSAESGKSNSKRSTDLFQPVAPGGLAGLPKQKPASRQPTNASRTKPVGMATYTGLSRPPSYPRSRWTPYTLCRAISSAGLGSFAS